MVIIEWLKFGEYWFNLIFNYIGEENEVLSGFKGLFKMLRLDRESLDFVIYIFILRIVFKIDYFFFILFILGL